MSKQYYYAVKKGRKPGIYESWYGSGQASEQVNRYPGALYKKFDSRSSAEAFLESGKTVVKEFEAASDAGDIVFPENYAFTDGSFNASTGVYGYGGFLVASGSRYTLRGKGNDINWASSRNVAGEVAGAMACVNKALELKLDTLTIYYDYAGVEYWATGEWKTNKTSSKSYADFMRDAMTKLSIDFVHVKAHTGIPGNEEADLLAKESVGL